MKYGGVLDRYNPKKDTFCVCDVCKVIWKDEVINYGSIYCPNDCGNALGRGLSRTEAMDLIDKKHMELL